MENEECPNCSKNRAIYDEFVEKLSTLVEDYVGETKDGKIPGPLLIFGSIHYFAQLALDGAPNPAEAVRIILEAVSESIKDHNKGE